MALYSQKVAPAEADDQFIQKAASGPNSYQVEEEIKGKLVVVR